MEFHELSKSTQQRITVMREHATRLRAAIAPKHMQRMLDNVLQDLDHIPKMVSSEPYVSAMLDIPQSTLNSIQIAFDKFGGKIEAVPDR